MNTQHKEICPDCLNVLVFPAGSEIAFEIFQALKNQKRVNLIGGTSEDNHAELLFKKCLKDMPHVGKPGFMEHLNRLIKQNAVNYVYPAHDVVLAYLSKHVDELNAALVASPPDTVAVCRSKLKTYDYFRDCGFIPIQYNSADEIEEYPVFLKPAIGQSSIGAQLIHDRDELLRELSGGELKVISEYLPGKEFTIDCFTDRQGVLRIIKPRVRLRIRGGISVRSKLIDLEPEIEHIAQTINNRLTFNGAWFFQLKEDRSNTLKLLEIAPRISGTMGLSRGLGLNFPMLTLYNMLGLDIEIAANGYGLLVDKAFISRYISDVSFGYVYIDFDDTIIRGDEVNWEVMSFLYQMKNRGVPVCLLTRHEKDIHQTLRHFAISSILFDNIITIPPGARKSTYITRSDAIFIDDSFAERLEVAKEKHLPVFDVDTLEILMDWRG